MPISDRELEHIRRKQREFLDAMLVAKWTTARRTLGEKDALEIGRKVGLKPILVCEFLHYWVSSGDLDSSWIPIAEKIQESLGEKAFDQIEADFSSEKLIKIFISYSSRDRELRELLIEGVKNHLTHRKKIAYELWNDMEIDLGADWKNEIETALLYCDVAILLVSANFASSSFIKEKELAAFFKRKKEERFLILPVLIRNYNFNQFEMLSSLNFFKTYYSEYGFNKPIDRHKLVPFDVLADDEKTSEKQLQDYYKKLADFIHTAVSNHYLEKM
jgi:hypothetical protein